jgi:hypothetical protein
VFFFYQFGTAPDGGMDPAPSPIRPLGLQYDDVQVPDGGNYLVDWQCLLTFKVPSLRALQI